MAPSVITFTSKHLIIDMIGLLAPSCLVLLESLTLHILSLEEEFALGAELTQCFSTLQGRL